MTCRARATNTCSPRGYEHHLFVVEGAGCVRGPAAGMGVKLLRDEAARIPHPRQLLPVPLPPLTARKSVTDVRLAAAVQRQNAGSDCWQWQQAKSEPTDCSDRR